MNKREVKSGMITTAYINRGYGFIQPDDSEECIFFHETALLNYPMEELRVGDEVAYILVNVNNERIQAGHIRVFKSFNAVTNQKNDAALTGVIRKINHDDGSGKIRTLDGNRYTFYEASLENISMSNLKVGESVEFLLGVSGGELVVPSVTISKYNTEIGKGSDEYE